MRARGPEAVASTGSQSGCRDDRGQANHGKRSFRPLKAAERRGPQTLRVQPLGRRATALHEEQLSEEASKLKLDQQSPWKEQLALARANILTQAYLAKQASGAPVPGAEDPKAYFDSHTADYEQFKLSGILVAFSPPGTPAGSGAVQRTEAQAQEKANDLEKKIKGGGDFAALARSDSDQQQTSVRGGDMGTFTMGDPNVPPAIKSAVTKLQPGQVSEPIRVQGGFFIFRA